MAEIRACDACGKQSPDEQGLYIANSWPKLFVEQSYHSGGNRLRQAFSFMRHGSGMQKATFEICNQCWDVIQEAMDKVGLQIYYDRKT